AYIETVDAAKGGSIRFLMELDPSAANAGGPIIRQRCRLAFDGELRPLQYVSEAQGARVMLGFTPDLVDVRLPDGSAPKVPRDGSEFIGESNIAGLDAIFYALMHQAGPFSSHHASLQIFLLNPLI